MGTARDFVVKKGLNVAEGITLGGHSFNDIDITSEATDADDHIMTALAIKNRIDDIASPLAGSTSITTVGTIGAGTWGATDVAVAHGGTGSSSASGARTNLGVGPTAGNTSLVTTGTITTGVWQATDIAVAHGGTGVSTLTNGGVLLGSGTGAITAMAVLSDGQMIVGDGTTDPVAESGATLRTSIGVGTGDTVQFTGINLGHASDTTIARASAGQITVEGTAVVLAGGANHDGFSDFVANEHIDHSGVTITAGTGMTGGVQSPPLEPLNVIGGDGITANANDVAITAAQTTITSVLNTGLVIGRDSTDQIKFGTDNQIIFRVGNADGVTFKASGEIEATKFDGALEGNADTATAAATVGVNPNDAGGSFVNENNLIMFLPDADGSHGAGNYRPESSTDFHYNPGTTILTVPKITSSLTGDVVGNVTGNASGSAGTVTTIGNLTGDVTSSNRATTIANNAVSLAKMAGITRGSIIIGNASGDPAALAIGSNDYVLTSDGTDIAWEAAGGGGASFNPLEFKKSGSNITTNETFLPNMPMVGTNSFAANYVFYYARKIHFTPLWSASGGTLNRLKFRATSELPTAGSDDWKIVIYSANDEGWPETLMTTPYQWTPTSAWGATLASIYATNGTSQITLAPNTWYWIGYLGASSTNGGNVTMGAVGTASAMPLSYAGTVNFNNYIYWNASSQTSFPSTLTVNSGHNRFVSAQGNYLPRINFDYVVDSGTWA